MTNWLQILRKELLIYGPVVLCDQPPPPPLMTHPHNPETNDQVAKMELNQSRQL